MRREGRLGGVALLTLTAGHPGGADPRAQGPLRTGRQVVDGARQILKQRPATWVNAGFSSENCYLPVCISGLSLNWRLFMSRFLSG